MKKIGAIILMLVIFASTSISAMAWWDRNSELDEEQFYLGYGVRLVLENQTSQTQGNLVPKNSHFAEADGHTTKFVFEYKLYLEEDLENFDLVVLLSNLKIGDKEYMSINNHNLMNVEINSSSGEFIKQEPYNSKVDSDFNAFKISNVLESKKYIFVTLQFYLEEQNDNTNFNDAYYDLAGKKVSFDIEFAVPNITLAKDKDEIRDYEEKNTNENNEFCFVGEENELICP